MFISLLSGLHIKICLLVLHQISIWEQDKIEIGLNSSSCQPLFERFVVVAVDSSSLPVTLPTQTRTLGLYKLWVTSAKGCELYFPFLHTLWLLWLFTFVHNRVNYIGFYPITALFYKKAYIQRVSNVMTERDDWDVEKTGMINRWTEEIAF